jgi:signal transduction histidine kinase/outer membrane protein assembly factor BamB
MIHAQKNLQGSETTRMAISVLILALLLTVPSSGALRPWRLETRFSSYGQLLVTERAADFNGDGVDEYVAFNRYFSNLLCDQTGIAVAQISTPWAKQRSFLGAKDFDQDGKSDLLIALQSQGDTAYIGAWSSSGHTIFLHELCPLPDIGGSKGWTGALSDAAFLDVNKDGREEVIVAVAAGFDLRPRSVFALDWKTGEILWVYSVAPGPLRVHISDVNGDGEQEVILTTWAPFNGAELNGLNDRRSRVFVLSRVGSLLYQREIGEEGTLAEAAVGDVDLDTHQEIVASAKGGLAADTVPNALYVFDGTTGDVEAVRSIRTRFYGLKVRDYDRDGKPEIIVGAEDGILRVLDSRLSVLKEAHLGDFRVDLSDVIDLDGDGSFEILVKAADSRLTVLNERLEEVLSHDIGPSFALCPLRNGRNYRILASSANGTTLYDIAKPLPVSGSRAYLSVLTVSLAIVAVLVAFFAQRSVGLASFASSAPFPVLAERRNGVVSALNEKARSVLGSQELSVDRISSEDFPYAAHRFSLFGRKYIVLAEKRARDSGERMVAWAGMAQRLAHDFKNPLSILMLATQRLKPHAEGTKGEKYVDTIMEELQRLRRWVDGFMRFLSLKGPQVVPSDVGNVLSRLKERFGQTLPDAVSLDIDIGQDVPLISADQSLLEEALGNILDNALSAVGSDGQVTVRVSKEERIAPGSAGQAVEEVEIEISDDGPGISEEDQKKLFTPYFTRKPSGTGLGLVIAKRVVEDHQGSIRVESKPGIGTRVVISLPVSQKVQDV